MVQKRYNNLKNSKNLLLIFFFDKNDDIINFNTLLRKFWDKIYFWGEVCNIDTLLFTYKRYSVLS
jgi:hypothetical protein